MVFGDPNKFSILMEYLYYKDGLFYFIVNGQMFPTFPFVSILAENTLCLEQNNPLTNPPENKELFFMDKLDAYTQIMNKMNPEVLNRDFETPDDFEEDRSYNATTDNIGDDSSYVFAIGYQEQIRILVAKRSFLSGNPDDGYEWIDYDNLEVAEVILPKIEVQKIIYGVREYYDLVKQYSKSKV